jgi:sortase A
MQTVAAMKLPLIGIIFSLVIALSSVWQFTNNSLISLQNVVTQGLLHTAWVRTQSSGHQVQPWPWAETVPIARLSIPRLNAKHVVLAYTDQKLPPIAITHANSSIPPGELGNSILNISPEGYRSFLRRLKPGDILLLESVHSGLWRYRVSTIYVVEKSNTVLIEPSLNRRLTLVSCYRCDQQQKNRFRYVVVAEEMERVSSTSSTP